MYPGICILTLRSTHVSRVIRPKIHFVKYRYYLHFLLKIYLHIYFCERFEIWRKMRISDLAYWFKSFLERHEIGIKDLIWDCPSMVLTLKVRKNSGLDIENKSAKTVVEQMQQSCFCCSCLKNQFWAQRNTCSSAQHSMNTICGKTTKVKNECLQYWQRKVTSLLPLTE